MHHMKTHQSTFITTICFLICTTLLSLNSLKAQEFTEITEANLPGVYLRSAAWGDYDNDGLLDIIITGNSTSGRISKLYRNNGDGSFSENTNAIFPGVNYSSVAWGDYDNDGFLDLLITGSGNSGYISKLYRNNGDETFTENTNIVLPGVSSSSVTWGDYDNDGKLDFIICGFLSDNSYYTKLLQNNCIYTFSEQK